MLIYIKLLGRETTTAWQSIRQIVRLLRQSLNEEVHQLFVRQSTNPLINGQSI